jgi:hypothetical protein
VRFAFIATEKANYPVALMCRVLQVSRSGYYAWCGRPTANHTAEDQRLALEVGAIYAESRGCYGRSACGVARARPTDWAQARGAADAGGEFARS